MSNKVMIVSGGASGLGLAAAEKFAKNGYNIVLIDIDETKGKNDASLMALNQFYYLLINRLLPAPY